MVAVIRHGGSGGSGNNPFAHLMGWDVQASFKAVQGKKFRTFAIQNPVGDYKGNRRMLWEYTRKVLGADTENYSQEIGDCFVAGTMVRMADGSEKPIESVEIGDKVLSHKGNPRTVTDTIAKSFSGELIRTRAHASRWITSTPDHRFINSSGEKRWESIGEMKIGQSLSISNPDSNLFGISSPIVSMNGSKTSDSKVFCLEIEEDHSFIANGYDVHNCVSFAGKNSLEYLTCVEIALNGESQKFRKIFPPYFYGTSRVQIGQRQLGNSDGSTGVWLQRATKDYGVLSADETNVPQYSGQIAKQWGYQGPPDEFIQIGKQHLVKTTSQVLSSADVANAIYNGYPVVVCSNQGFNMQAGSDGFHSPGRDPWGHSMAIIGYEDHPQYGLYFIILNSWGDQHGRLKDFTSGADLPIGILRVRGEIVDRMASEFQDTWAFSQYDGYPDQAAKLDKALFDLIGN